MRRRGFLAAAVAAGAVCTVAPPATAMQHGAQGCSISAHQYRQLEASGAVSALMSSATDAGSVDLVMTTGDPALDRHLGRALLRLATTFGVSPGFAFFDDEEGENAFAASVTRMPGTWGTVLFGQRLFNRVMGVVEDGLGVLAVCAHEFAHNRQHMNEDLYGRLLAAHETVKICELHADFMAGFFMAERKSTNSELKLYSLGPLVHAFGDTNFGARNHHGTPDERLEAWEAGFFFGRSGRYSADEASDEGERMVMRFI